MRNKLIIVLCLLASLVLANLHFNKKEQYILINNVFPMQIANWQGKNIPVEKSTYEMLDKQELLSREYKNTNNGKKLYLSIVLTNKRDHIHDPNVCASGQGIFIKKENRITLNKQFYAVFADSKLSNSRLYMLYWYTDLDKTYNNRINFLKSTTKNLFLDKISGKLGLVIVQGEQNQVKKQDVLNFAVLVNENLKKLRK